MSSSAPFALRKDSSLPYLLLIAAIACVYYASLFSNVPPGGDGSRILPYATFINHADSLLPLWNPYIVNGSPTLAHSARFIWLGHLIDASWTYAPLLVNLAMLLGIIASGWCVFALCRAIDLGRPASALAGLLHVCASPMAFAVLRSGRLNIVLMTIMIHACCLLYVLHLKRRSFPKVVAIAFLSGLILNSGAHYILLTYLPAFLFFGYLTLSRQGTSIIRATGTLLSSGLCIAVLGLLLTAPLNAPLVHYQMQNFLHGTARGAITPLEGQSLVNLFFPIFNIFEGPAHHSFEACPFVSLALLPLLASLFVLPRRPSKALLVLLGVSALTIFLLSGIPPADRLLEGFLSLPGFKHFRHSGPFLGLVSSALVFSCAMIFDSVRTAENNSPAKALCASAGTTAAIFLLAWGAHVLQQQHDVAADGPTMLSGLLTHLSAPQIIALSLLLVPLPLLPGAGSRFAFLVVLIGIQAVIFNYPERNTAVPFEADLSEAKRILNEDREEYLLFSRYYPLFDQEFATVRKIAGFSFHISKEQELMLRVLLGRKEMTSRPHWALGSKTQLHVGFAELLGVKYALLKVGPAAYHPVKTWARMTTNKPILYMNQGWSQPLRLFHSWEVLENEDMHARLMQTQKLVDGPMLLEKQPVFSAGSPSSGDKDEVRLVERQTDSLTLNVESRKPSLVLVPEIFDSGWTATLDGRRVEVLRSFGCLRAVAVPAGSSVLRMEYRPASFVWGMRIAVTTLLLCLGYWLAFRRGRATA